MQCLVTFWNIAFSDFRETIEIKPFNLAHHLFSVEIWSEVTRKNACQVGYFNFKLIFLTDKILELLCNRQI